MNRFLKCVLSVLTISDTISDLLLSILKQKVNIFLRNSIFKVQWANLRFIACGFGITCCRFGMQQTVCFDPEFFKSPFAVNPNRLFDCQYRQRHNSNIFVCQDKKSRL